MHITVFVLFIFAAFAFLFAPEGRETVAYIVGSVLLVLGLGAIGVNQFILKVPGIELHTKGKADITT